MKYSILILALILSVSIEGSNRLPSCMITRSMYFDTFLMKNLGVVYDSTYIDPNNIQSQTFEIRRYFYANDKLERIVKQNSFQNITTNISWDSDTSFFSSEGTCINVQDSNYMFCDYLNGYYWEKYFHLNNYYESSNKYQSSEIQYQRMRLSNDSAFYDVYDLIKIDSLIRIDTCISSSTACDCRRGVLKLGDFYGKNSENGVITLKWYNAVYTDYNKLNQVWYFSEIEEPVVLIKASSTRSMDVGTNKKTNLLGRKIER